VGGRSREKRDLGAQKRKIKSNQVGVRRQDEQRREGANDPRNCGDKIKSHLDEMSLYFD
jgi:hypothetical protein